MVPRPLNRLLIHLMIQLASVTHVGTVLILVGGYRPLVALGCGLALGAALGGMVEARIFGWRPRVRTERGNRPRWGLLLVLAVAAACRLGPTVDFSGERAAGREANLAVFLAGSGSFTHQDRTLPGATGSGAAADGRRFLEIIRPNGAVSLPSEVPPGFRGKYEGRYLDGVDVAEVETLTYVFAAAPGGPVWLSIGAALMGPTGVGLATSLFGLLAVVCLHQLILTVTRRQIAALGFALPLAIAPLLPGRPGSEGSEPIWLAFLLGSLLALATSLRMRDDPPMRRLCAGLGVGGFSAFCLCVANGYVLLPGLVAGAVAAVGRPDRRPIVTGTMVGLLAVSGLALVAGYAVSFGHAFEAAGRLFAPVLGAAWPRLVPWLAVVAVALTVALLRAGGGQAGQDPAPGWRRLAGGLTVPLLLLGAGALLAGGGRFDDHGAPVVLADLESAVKAIGAEDLLVLDERDLDHGRLVLPMIYALDRNVWTFADRRRMTEMFESSDLFATYESVLVASGQTDLPAWFEPAGTMEIDSKDLADASGASEALPLWRLGIPRLDAETQVYPGSGVSVRGIHGDGWTGPRAVLTFDLADPERDRLRIELRDWRPAAIGARTPVVALRLNGQPIEPSLVSPERILCPLPRGLLAATTNELVIEAATFVPREVDPASTDGRDLGIVPAAVVLR